MVEHPKRHVEPKLERVASFVDGFNVFHGLRSKGFTRFYWLDYRSLVETLIRPPQQLVSVTYFTTRVGHPPEDVKDQSTYIDALRARGGLEVVEGTYKRRPVRCPECGYGWKRPTEKMTDVSVATAMVAGALRDSYDAAILVCADADLIPAVRLVKEEGKHVIIVSPRGRTSDELAAEGDAHLHWNTSVLGKCQLPSPLVSLDGVSLTRPPHWV